jgi:hypothetical protein
LWVWFMLPTVTLLSFWFGVRVWNFVDDSKVSNVPTEQVTEVEMVVNNPLSNCEGFESTTF